MLFPQSGIFQIVEGRLLAGGALLDTQNNGVVLWLLMGSACLMMLPALRSLQPRYRSSTERKPSNPERITDAIAGPR